MIFATFENESHEAEVGIIAQSVEELRTLAAGIIGTDSEFADQLLAVAGLTEVCGLSPNSTRFAGARFIQLTEGLRCQTGLRAGHAALMLEGAALVDLRGDLDDPIGAIMSAPPGPHSGVITEDQARSGYRRVPLIIR